MKDTSNKIVIGTFNTAKYKDFAVYLGDTYQIERPPYELEIPEGMDSLEENAIAKARTWAILTGKVAIADDTGFFINALPGEPGVAARRWGGELPDGSTNEDFWKLLQQKTKDLDDLSAYVEQCVAMVSPSGKVEVVYNRTAGYLDKEKLKRPYNNSGYPLAAAFVADNRVKAWDDMSNQEKAAFSRPFIEELKEAIHRVQSSA